jgi:tetratricopeptide (TPR) repeat protein
VVSQRLTATRDLVWRHRLPLAAVLAVAAAVCALYVPFLSNPLVFDDRGYFTGREFALYATGPFGVRPRFPAAFSIAVVYVIYGTVEAQRIVGLALHVATCCALFWLIRVLQDARAESPPSADRAVPSAALATAFFGLHPVAVYGAAYLAQRSIVMATLFGVLSVALFARGIVVQRYGYAVAAAAVYSVALMSKEHAAPLIAVAPVVGWAITRNRVFAIKYALIYVLLNIPALDFVYYQVWGTLQAELVGQAHEATSGELAGQAAAAIGGTHAQWLASALSQAALFFRYWLVWIVPATSWMAIDLRVDLPATWSPAVAMAASAGYLAVGALAAFLIVRRGRAAMIGIGLAWFWTLYLLEFAVVRFAEPFVLYRGYLWAPGIAILLAALVARLPPRVVTLASVVLAAVLAWQAHDRLRTFSSGLALWEDAVAKLPAAPIPGASRSLYELGREYFYQGQADKAGAVIERCMAQYPDEQRCVLARASMLLSSERYEEALPYLGRLIAAEPDAGAPRHHLGFALERLGCRDQARAQYELSLKLGYRVAGERLKSLDHPGTGIAPRSSVRRDKPFACAEALKNVPEPRR